MHAIKKLLDTPFSEMLAVARSWAVRGTRTAWRLISDFNDVKEVGTPRQLIERVVGVGLYLALIGVVVVAGVAIGSLFIRH